MPAEKRPAEEYDSEEDEDFMPSDDDDSSSSVSGDDDPENEGEPLTLEQQVAKEKKDLNKVWEDFEASVGTAPTEIWDDKLVKIVRTSRCNGEEHEEVFEVPEDSEDAKRWPRYEEPAESSLTNPESASTSTKRKPGPRKPKTTLTPLPGPSKPKKLTTLEMSTMDWTKHVEGEKESGIKDELEAHRKDGGYLDRVEFLQRVDERKETKRRKL